MVFIVGIFNRESPAKRRGRRVKRRDRLAFHLRMAVKTFAASSKPPAAWPWDAIRGISDAGFSLGLFSVGQKYGIRMDYRWAIYWIINGHD